MGNLEIQGDRLPIEIAAGVIKEESDINAIADDEILYGTVLGTYTAQERVITSQAAQWHPDLNKFYNRIRLHNPGRQKAQSFLPAGIRRLQSAGMRVRVSVGTAEGEDPLKVLPENAQWAVETGADAVELNVSCPSLDDKSGFLAHKLPQVQEVAARVRERIGKESALVLKVPNLWRTLIFQYAAADLPVDGIVTANSVRGWSGPGLNALYQLNLQDFAQAYGRSPLKLFSTGGIAGNLEGGREIHRRANGLGAFVVGTAQAAYRAPDIRSMVTDLAQGYIESPEA